MPWRHARCQQWYQGRKLGPLPFEPLETEVKSHHKTILQSSVKTLNKCAKTGRLEKMTEQHFHTLSWSTSLKSSSPQSPWQPHHRLPGPGPGDLPDVIMHQKWHCSHLPKPQRWHWGAAPLLALQCTGSSALPCTVKIYCPPPSLPLNSESGISSGTDPGFWYILHGLLNTNFHHSSALSHTIITYRSATIFCGVSAVSQMAS